MEKGPARGTCERDLREEPARGTRERDPRVTLETLERDLRMIFAEYSGDIRESDFERFTRDFERLTKETSTQLDAGRTSANPPEFYRQEGDCTFSTHSVGG